MIDGNGKLSPLSSKLRANFSPGQAFYFWFVQQMRQKISKIRLPGAKKPGNPNSEYLNHTCLPKRRAGTVRIIGT